MRAFDTPAILKYLAAHPEITENSTICRNAAMVLRGLIPATSLISVYMAPLYLHRLDQAEVVVEDDYLIYKDTFRIYSDIGLASYGQLASSTMEQNGLILHVQTITDYIRVQTTKPEINTEKKLKNLLLAKDHLDKIGMADAFDLSNQFINRHFPVGILQ